MKRSPLLPWHRRLHRSHRTHVARPTSADVPLPHRRRVFQPPARAFLVGASPSNDDDGGPSAARRHRHAHRSVLTVHPRHLYQIVNDVDAYRKFLPYCRESRILRRSECGTMYDAVLSVGLPGLPSVLSSGTSSSLLEERYVSRVRMIPPPDFSADVGDAGRANEDNYSQMWMVEAKSIQSQLFDSLKSRWQLTLLPNDHTNAWDNDDGNCANDQDGPSAAMKSASCGVRFEVEIGVSNPLISLTLDRVLEDVARRQVEAFERRCHEIPFRT